MSTSLHGTVHNQTQGFRQNRSVIFATDACHKKSAFEIYDFSSSVFSKGEIFVPTKEQDYLCSRIQERMPGRVRSSDSSNPQTGQLIYSLDDLGHFIVWSGNDSIISQIIQLG